jgi:alginate O-acetyltransferase complex protein AlgI
MLFNSVSYLLFVLIVVLAFWVIPEKHRQRLLLVASIVFYGLWRVEFVFLITFSAWVDYFFSLRISETNSPVSRRTYLLASLATNLLLLVYFKYTYFIVGNIELLGHVVGHEWKFDPGAIILPLGISFYTFLSISYTVDVYRRRFEPIRSFPTYLTYVLFWPHMIAGPILRAHELLPQLVSPERPNKGEIAAAIRYILFGLFLKVVMADNLAPLVDAAFNTPARNLGGTDVWTMAFGFGLQIYFDFAGYSMIAIGSALLVGVRFPENFNWPYLATSPREFWKRWHITLSSWVRDYLYLPLCGLADRDRSDGGIEVVTTSQSDRARIVFALFVTWAVMGLWHGAAWRFAIWGLWHATLIYLYRVFPGHRLAIPKSAMSIIGWGVTLAFSMLAWIPFRAEDLETTFALLARIADPGSYFRLGLRENFYLTVFLMFFSMLIARGVWASTKLFENYPAYRAVAEVGVLSLAMSLVFIFLRPVSQFIYFQF